MKLNHLIIIGALCGALLIPSTASTWGVIGLSGGVEVPDYCESCSDDTDADILCETFESTQECTWSIGETGGANGDATISTAKDDSPALGCKGNMGANAASFVKTSTNHGVAMAYIDYTNITTAYTQFYIKILAEGLSDTNEIALVNFMEAWLDTNAFNLGIIQISGNLYFRLGYRNGAWASDTGGTAISLDKWYGVRMYFNDAGASSSCSWAVDYDLDGTYTDEGSFTNLNFDRTERYIMVGFTDTTYTINYQVDGLKVDANAYPDDCAR